MHVLVVALEHSVRLRVVSVILRKRRHITGTAAVQHLFPSLYVYGICSNLVYVSNSCIKVHVYPEQARCQCGDRTTIVQVERCPATPLIALP